MSQIEFTSEKFLPYLPEDSQANPGAYGFELAAWLSQALMKGGVPTSYPLGEDWGWFIEFIDGDTEIMIGCGSQSAEGDGYKGIAIDWRIFVKQQLSFKQRLKGGSRPELISKLTEAIVAALRSEGIEPSVDTLA